MKEKYVEGWEGGRLMLGITPSPLLIGFNLKPMQRGEGS
jgi:hypothetical protein